MSGLCWRNCWNWLIEFNVAYVKLMVFAENPLLFFLSHVLISIHIKNLIVSSSLVYVDIYIFLKATKKISWS